MIVVIPCYDETELIKSLTALHKCMQPTCNVEVITVINASEHERDEVKKRNLKSFDDAINWAKEKSNTGIQFHFILKQDLPQKHAGVGLARKIGMDEAVRRFEKNNKDGIIVCFDADSLCASNYLVEIEGHFVKKSTSPGCSIHFEHPLNGNDFENEIYSSIAEYELFLRYYKQSLSFCGLPFAFHTIGSSMAVRSFAYQKQGGMNKRKAGEDFYFLQKIIALGNFSELNSTKVIPSPRTSHRVPFGTGKAISERMNSLEKEMKVYSFRIFEEIKVFVAMIPVWYENRKWNKSDRLSDEFNEFLINEGVEQKWNEMIQHSSGKRGFESRMFEWFDAFFVLKLVHHLRDVKYPNEPIADMCNLLLKSGGEEEIIGVKELLDRLREIDIKK